MSRRFLRKRNVTLMIALIVAVVGLLQAAGWLGGGSSGPTAQDYADRLNPKAEVQGTQTSQPPAALPANPQPGSVQTTPEGQVTPGAHRVLSVSDGDTIRVDIDGKNEKIRLTGVDTPETSAPNTPRQCYGKEATDFTKLLTMNTSVRLEKDPKSSDRDRYGRLLRYVYLQDGRLLQAELIGQGYGFAYLSFPFTKSDEFKASQEKAVAEKRGLWAVCQPVRNEYGNYTSNPAS